MKITLKFVCTFLLILVGFVAQAQDKNLQLAQQYYIQGDFEKAVIYYEKVYQKDQSHPNFTRYYECLLKTNDVKEAEKVLKKQIDKFPSNLDYSFQYASFLEDNNRAKEADKIYSDLIKTRAVNNKIIMDLYHSFRDAGKLNYAKQTLDLGRKSFGDRFPLYMEFAEYYYLNKNFPKMMDEYLDYIPIFQNAIPDVQERLSDLINDNDDNAEFQDIVKNKILSKVQKNSDNFIYSEMLIWYFAQRKQFGVALTQVQALDKRENGSGKRVYELGMICLQNKDYATAGKAFRYVLDIPNSHLAPNARKALLNVRFLEITETKNYDNASIQTVINEFEDAIKNVNNTRLSYDLIKQLAAIQAYYANQAPKAIANLNTLVKTAGLTSMQLAEAKVLLADIYVMTNEIWEASLLYMQVDSEFKFEPIGFEAKYKNAKIFYYTGDFKFAQSQLDVLKQSTTKLIANDAMKLSVLITDNFGLDSNYKAMSLFAHADLLLEQHLYDQSFALYDSIIKVYPQSGLTDEVALRKATAMKDLGKWDKAIDYLTEITTYHAFDILMDDALYHLGVIYQEHKNDPEKAMEYYKKLIFEHPASLHNADARERFRKLRGES